MSDAVRNQIKLEQLVEELSKNGGSMARAAKAARVSYGWIKSWCRDDPKVEHAIREAVEAGTSVLEDAAITRAVKGVKEPIFYNGNLVGHKRKYSDGLLEMMLKARKPDTYGNKLDINKTVTIKTLSDDEIDARIIGLQRQLGLTDQSEEAEYTEVLEEIGLEDLL